MSVKMKSAGQQVSSCLLGKYIRFSGVRVCYLGVCLVPRTAAVSWLWLSSLVLLRLCVMGCYQLALSTTELCSMRRKHAFHDATLRDYMACMEHARY